MKYVNQLILFFSGESLLTTRYEPRQRRYAHYDKRKRRRRFLFVNVKTNVDLQ